MGNDLESLELCNSCYGLDRGRCAQLGPGKLVFFKVRANFLDQLPAFFCNALYDLFINGAF